MNEVKSLLKELRNLGVEYARTANGHYKVYQSGRMIAVLSSTPSEPRALKNARALLRRAGIAV